MAEKDQLALSIDESPCAGEGKGFPWTVRFNDTPGARTYGYKDTTLTPIAGGATDTEVVRKFWGGHAEVDIGVLIGAVRKMEYPMKFFLATYFGPFFLQY